MPHEGLRVGSYTLSRRLGTGGMGEVWAARHDILGIDAALKVLHTDGPRSRERLIREGRAQAALDHPNLLPVRDVVAHGDGLALVLPLVRGPSLWALREQHAPDEAESLALFREIVLGVAHAHAQGFVHRDLKPANVLLDPQHDRLVPRVADFGIVKHAETESLTAEGVMMGSHSYAAPEQQRDAATVDVRADVYSLGVLLVELLTGRRPGQLPDFATWEGAATDLELSSMGAAWQALVERMVHPDPDRRLADAGTLLAELDALHPPPGSSPLAADRPIFEAARTWWRDRHPATPPVAAPEPSRSAWPSSPPTPPAPVLPLDRDVFVGRETELAQLGRTLAGPHTRLVTVVGPGGVGKTRLTRRFARQTQTSWPGGVWLCDLSDARSVEGIAFAVATALDVPLGKEDPIVQLGHAIAGRGRCLVILDNFEQVTAHAASTVGRWLDRVRNAQFLVTSREVLGLPGEAAVQLPPLEPEEAVALFDARAQQADANYTPQPRVVEKLVRLLDHLPLAIELAASRVRIMSPTSLLDRIGDRFRLLTSTGDLPVRQATLRGALDWSWDLLSTEEQRALAQLSVFEGGFALAAAESVVEAGDAWGPDLVQSLVEKSLVRRVDDDRFDLLMSVQAYASERLDASGDRDAAEVRHGTYFAALGTDEARRAVRTRAGVAARQAFRLDLANAVLACRRAVARGDETVAVDAMFAAWTTLEIRGPYAVAEELARAVTALPLDTARRARASFLLGFVHHFFGRLSDARTLYEASLAAYREVGDRAGEIPALGGYGSILLIDGQRDEAQAHFESGLAVAREAGDREQEVLMLGRLGNLHHLAGRMEQARTAYAAAIDGTRELGDRRAEGIVLSNKGFLHLQLEELDESLAHYRMALAASREMGDRRNEAIVYGNLAGLHLLQDDLERARASFETALTTTREVGNRRHEGSLLGGLGSLHLQRGELAEAREALVRAAARLSEVGDRLELAQVLATQVRLEVAQGRLDAAREILAEVESMAEALRIVSESPLGKTLDEARRALADASET